MPLQPQPVPSPHRPAGKDSPAALHAGPLAAPGPGNCWSSAAGRGMSCLRSGRAAFDLSACETSPALREQARRRAPQGVEIRSRVPGLAALCRQQFRLGTAAGRRTAARRPACGLGRGLPRGGLRSGPHLLEQRLPALADLAAARTSPCLARALPALLDRLATAGRPPGTTARGKLPLAARLPLASRDARPCRGPFPPALRGLVRPASGHVAPPYGHAPAPASAPPSGYRPPRHGVRLPAHHRPAPGTKTASLNHRKNFFCSRRPQRRGFSAFLSRPQRQTSLTGLAAGTALHYGGTS